MATINYPNTHPSNLKGLAGFIGCADYKRIYNYWELELEASQEQANDAIVQLLNDQSGILGISDRALCMAELAPFLKEKGIELTVVENVVYNAQKISKDTFDFAGNITGLLKEHTGKVIAIAVGGLLLYFGGPLLLRSLPVLAAKATRATKAVPKGVVLKMVAVAGTAGLLYFVYRGFAKTRTGPNTSTTDNPVYDANGSIKLPMDIYAKITAANIYDQLPKIVPLTAKAKNELITFIKGRITTKAQWNATGTRFINDYNKYLTGELKQALGTKKASISWPFYSVDYKLYDGLISYVSNLK